MGGIYVGKEALEYMREKTKNNCTHQHLKHIGTEAIFKCKDCGKVISKANHRDSMNSCLGKEDIDVIREILSEMACGIERNTFNYDCCDAKEILAKINKHFMEE